MRCSVNPSEAITGWYVDPTGVNHGYLQARVGTITAFNAAGAGNGASQGTTLPANNPAGAIAGLYVDAVKVNHGFSALLTAVSPHSTFPLQARLRASERRALASARPGKSLGIK
jgi:hypothetical protein